MPEVRTARYDPALRATLMSRRPLHYHDGADRSVDRPAHVRAGSSLSWVGDRLALVQDDANFVALIEPRTGHVRAVALPAGEGGDRQFDEGRGNKKHKLDLEACCTLALPEGPLLLALGSGSKRRRRRVVTVDRWTETEPRVTLVDATALYVALEAAAEFAGSDMNIEGAVPIGGIVRLFGRGNGRARDGRRPLDATCDLDAHDLLRWLSDPEAHEPPQPGRIVQYALGELDGISLGFTDAMRHGDVVIYAAAAEASEDAVSDGTISGSVIGVIPGVGPLRHTSLTEPDGAPATHKVEGIAASLRQPDVVFVVLDADDHEQPSELCEVRLEGPWFTDV